MRTLLRDGWEYCTSSGLAARVSYRIVEIGFVTRLLTFHIHAPRSPPPAEPGAEAEYSSVGRSLRILAFLPPCPQ